ncbi:fucolectin-5-like [Erythrolamprus reginae]|uniref:fucolectin-5-like n=1 Tax=Erythrolamprus reginae TaxID=121349 RepID=UPI00396C96BF
MKRHHVTILISSLRQGATQEGERKKRGASCHPSERHWMKLIVWGGLLAVTLLADLAATESCSPSRRAADNLALGKRAIQSSTLSNENGGPPEKAVDGDCNGVLAHGSCAHTNEERNPWWLVDLGGYHRIQQVVLKNRQDCCAERLYKAEVHLGNSLKDNGAANYLCGTVENYDLGAIITISCNGREGRYLSVNIPGTEYLALCEVEAYGTK